MQSKILAALPLIGALTFAGQAHAVTVSWTLSGGGVSGYGTITITPDTVTGDPAGAWSVIGATGSFSDSTIGTQAITGFVANNDLPPLEIPTDPLIPPSFSWWTGVGTPYVDASYSLLSYDNLYYPGGSPEVCTGYSYGGYLDNYGILFTLANGDVLDVYSDGNTPPPGTPDPPPTNIGIYGAAIGSETSGVYSTYYHDVFNEQGFPTGLLTFAPVPEPSTWAMLVLGFAGLGFAGHRTQRKSAVAA